MKILPINPTTHVNGHEWIPSSFSAFIQELEHFVSSEKKQNNSILFRGHSNYQWLLDSTFIRNVKKNILNVDPLSKIRHDYRYSKEYNRLIASLFLYKFSIVTQPSQDLKKLAKKGIDPFFEWMKRIQQYPNEDVSSLRGTFLIDWSKNEKVAMFFASDYDEFHNDGALWIVNLTATGKVLHRDLTLEKILTKYKKAFITDKPFGLPLVFFPRYQLECEQANNQEVVYVAQMDMRLDLFELWEKYEIENNKQVITKLRLPHKIKKECRNWLESNGITKKFLFPKI